MTIRNRLTIWYAGVMLSSLVLMAGVMYYELIYERRADLAAGRPRDPVPEEMSEVMIYYGVPTALATILGGWLFLRKLMTPLDQLTRAAERIHTENLQDPLPRTGNGDEVDRLTEVLNATNRRLSDSFVRIREFTLHASHELKTPLTVIRSELESVLHEETTPALSRERVASLLDEVERLTQIVDSLTFLTKADAGQLTLQRTQVALDRLMHDALEDAQALAHGKSIQVRMLKCDPATVMGDRRRLRQLLLILTDNAIKYNQPDGWVTLALNCADGMATVTIENAGPGMLPAAIERVFDRFYRGDTSHNGEVDGCGLGLTIGRWVARAHGGELVLKSRPNQSTTAIISLPCTNELQMRQNGPESTTEKPRRVDAGLAIG